MSLPVVCLATVDLAAVESVDAVCDGVVAEESDPALPGLDWSPLPAAGWLSPLPVAVDFVADDKLSPPVVPDAEPVGALWVPESPWLAWPL